MNMLVKAAAATAAVPATIGPALALPAPAALAAAATVTTEPRLLSLGDQLRAAMRIEAALAARARRLYTECDAARGPARDCAPLCTMEQSLQGERAFQELGRCNGYHAVHTEWGRAAERVNRTAKEILRIPSNDRTGDGIRAAASLVLNDDCRGAVEMAEILWEMAARAGFTLPADIARKLKRKGAPVPKRQRERNTRAVLAQARMADADRKMDELFEAYPELDCENTPGFLNVERRRDRAIADLTKTQAQTWGGLIAKAQALVNKRLYEDYQRHQEVAFSLAQDLLKYFGAVEA